MFTFIFLLLVTYLDPSLLRLTSFAPLISPSAKITQKNLPPPPFHQNPVSVTVQFSQCGKGEEVLMKAGGASGIV